ncbi:MAG: hypothetical protein JO270_19480 [Acidobacteriaceae bacterium]|nr:hypothetical protein [Acidobacteriaceae bacterium]
MVVRLSAKCRCHASSKPFANVKNGLANTILAIEAKDAVIWTKLADLVLPKDQDKLPPLGGLFRSSAKVLFADGSVRFFSPMELRDAKAIRKMVRLD